jgi:thioredoxin-related protein
VAQDGLPWKHVLRGYQQGERASSGATDINAKFGVSVLPTYILIDKEGKIIGRYSGEGKDTSELDRLLEKIFGKS